MCACIDISTRLVDIPCHSFNLHLSLLRSLFWTTLDRSPRVTPLCWTATLLTLPANSVSSKKRSIVVLARNLRTTQRVSNLEMQQSLPWCPENPCVLRASPSIRHWVSQAAFQPIMWGGEKNWLAVDHCKQKKSLTFLSGFCGDQLFKYLLADFNNHMRVKGNNMIIHNDINSTAASVA